MLVTLSVIPMALLTVTSLLTQALVLVVQTVVVFGWLRLTTPARPSGGQPAEALLGPATVALAPMGGGPQL